MNFGDDVPAVDAADVPQDAYLLDVREQEEWDAGHAPGAVHIPMSRLGDRAAEVPQDREVYVICRSGARSAQVTVALNQAGWLAKNVDGGMKRWAELGRPVENGGDGPPPFIA
ncbi:MULTISPECIES: rhodanese-like domain-containing protein [Thermomonosporaceae]|uniref:rhodanese-like domain-containing protein n=1 Tax=Thermomonosporaceae TaxID=2012 RepID=UPI00255A7B21|nr:MULTISPECIES: rhodanese-like domain-containing protein [Thermomonosporaceae]MDL4773573.1 rhodanese-like domain-containing protein [Actinomadura xylanilytica]